jgi:hypothetical protein
VVFGSVIILGGAVGVFVYNRATAVDRSTPVVSADAFMNAVAVEEDPQRVGLYTCAAWSATDAFTETTRLIDPQARTTWDTFVVVSQSESAAVIDARVRFRYPGEVAASGEKTWRFQMANEQGWRVCSVTPAP